MVGATGIGVGAIVGGGILVLGGAALEHAGPGAALALALNGLVGLVVALSVADLARAFPESGGAYAFARRVLSVRAAFAAGWVSWLAHLLASALYARGFAAYAVEAIAGLWDLFAGPGSSPPPWLGGPGTVLALALLVTLAYAASMLRGSAGASLWPSVAKVLVFVVIVVAGLIALIGQPVAVTRDALTPLLPHGASGLVTAMGFTFITIQGFEVVAAFGGQVKDPARNLPRGILLSLGIAIAVYVPLLLVVATLGAPPGQSIAAAAAASPDTILATAVRRFMGPAGYWLVVVAALLGTASALEANLLAACQVSRRMATDGTLPPSMARVHPRTGAPIMAAAASTLAVAALLFMVPDLAAAGAAASLIFLASFSLLQVTAVLARRRAAPGGPPSLVPLFPFLNIAGAVVCAALALFQATAVPIAGGIAVVWLGLGGLLYASLFVTRAGPRDAAAEALDPSLVRLRGRSPLVLVPIANPGHAPALVAVAHALAPKDADGRVVMLTVIRRNGETLARRVEAAQAVVGRALVAALEAGEAPEALLTVADDPWAEIRRVATARGCQALVLGVGDGALASTAGDEALERLLSTVDCDAAVLRAPPGWRLGGARSILVPVGGRGAHHGARARLLGTLCRDPERRVTFLRLVPPDAPEGAMEQARREAEVMAADLGLDPARVSVQVDRSSTEAAAPTINRIANDHDLIVLGMHRVDGRRTALGELAPAVLRGAQRAAILLSSRR